METAKEFLTSKGYTIDAIECKDDSLSVGRMDIVLLMEEYANRKVKALNDKNNTKVVLEKTKTAKECWHDAGNHPDGYSRSVREAMDEYADGLNEFTYKLFNNPTVELKPLEDLWRKENSPDEYVIPDRTKFYEWIRIKVLGEKKMVEYTIENNDGVYKQSDSFEINKKISLIKLIRLEPLEENGRNDLKELVYKFSINGEVINLSPFISAYNAPLSEVSLVVNVLIKSTDDLKFEIAKNSKIGVVLFFENKILGRVLQYQNKMENKLSLTIKGTNIDKTSSITKAVHFKFSPDLYMSGDIKSKSVFLTMFIEEQETGVMEIEWDDFNDFCLGLAAEHKKIMENR